MGSGPSKAHEAFPISPSAKPLDASATDTPPTPIKLKLTALAPSPGSGPEADPGLEPIASPADDIDHADPTPATKAAAAVWDQSAAWESAEVITPIPKELTPGNPNGTGLIVGGADLENSELTLMSYVNGSDTQELLYGWVHPDAEAKLLAALDTDESGLIPAELTKTVHGRLPLDDEHKIFESLVKYAKSVNHHAKAGNPPPAHTVEGLAQLQEELAALSEGSDVSAADKAMIADYLTKSDLIEQRCAAGFDKPYANGGKIPTLTAHEAEYVKTWTEMVQDPDAEQSGLATQKVKTTRGACKLVAGESQWDGTRKPDGKGQEYKIDLGDGFVARYRPHGQLDAAKGRQGSLEIQAPPGSGHAGELVGRLAQLNLISRPLTGAEAEWTYLSRNAWAQGIDTTAPTKAALASAAGLDETMQEVLFAEHAREAVGLSEAELDSWARRIRLEAETKALPFKVKVLRDAVSAQLGYSSGEALQTAPSYNPTPITEGTGFHTWNRFDVAGDTTLPDKFASKILTHHVTGNNLADMVLNSGVLASTERRSYMGVNPGLGMSEGADVNTGGSRVVDLRIKTKGATGKRMLVWDDPTRLLARSDWYAYNGDKFAGFHSTGQTRNPEKLLTHGAANNEVLFRDGIDLLGEHGPDRILTCSAKERKQILDGLTAKGITTIRGKKIDEVIK